MKKFYALIFICLAFLTTANAETWTFPSDVDNAILQTTEGIQVCTGTGDLVLATGCTGGGTQYTVTLDAASGSFSRLRLPHNTPLLSEDSGGVEQRILILRDSDDTRLIAGSGHAIEFGIGAGNGTGVAEFDAGGLNVVDGSSSAPSIAFLNDTDTGLYANGSGRIAFSSNGTYVAEFKDTGIRVGPGGSAGSPSYHFSTDIDTGLYSVASNRLGIATGGAVRWEVTEGGVFRMYTNGGAIEMRSPDGTYSSCVVDNSDNFTCTGL